MPWSITAPHFMTKLFSIAISLCCVLGFGACSRSDEAALKPTPTPNQNLQKDAERLQQATANIARERAKAGQASPTPTASP
jgi:energy-converting hydrogenase Eha subunit F